MVVVVVAATRERPGSDAGLGRLWSCLTVCTDALLPSFLRERPVVETDRLAAPTRPLVLDLSGALLWSSGEESGEARRFCDSGVTVGEGRGEADRLREGRPRSKLVMLVSGGC